jgi:TolB-like protein/tetratricopeptide (TPR) repeat protein
VVAVEVFRKEESFDPRTDTVVRAEARRLRHKLAEYYQNEGQNDSIEIELPKGGYCPVFRQRVVAAPPIAPERRPRRRTWLWASVGAAAMIAIVYGSWIRTRGLSPGEPPSIAILPLENLSGDPDQEYFSDGMTDALITDLAKIGDLRVISRTSVLQFKRSKKTIPEIASQLKVKYVLEGTIAASVERVRVTAQLIAAPADRHLWAESYERPRGDILRLQGELAMAIAGRVHARITPEEHARMGVGAVNPVAVDSYLRGRFNWHTRDDQRLWKSIEDFNQALSREPRYALAYAGLSDSYSVLAGRSVGQERREREQRSCAAAAKAIELDDSLGEAHASLGACADQWKWQEREREFRRAIQLSPSYATAHQWYATLLTDTGRLEQGTAEARRAVELDPLSPSPGNTFGWALYMERQYDRAIEQYRQTVEVFPSYVQAYTNLGIAYCAKGMYAEAIRTLKEAVRIAGGAPPVSALLAHAHAVTGDKTEAERLLKEWKREEITPIVFALLYLDIGDKDHAFQWLDRGIAQRSMYMDELKVEPMFDRLHSDPRFPALLRKMNLEN